VLREGSRVPTGGGVVVGRSEAMSLPPVVERSGLIFHSVTRLVSKYMDSSGRVLTRISNPKVGTSTTTRLRAVRTPLRPILESNGLLAFTTRLSEVKRCGACMWRSSQSGMHCVSLGCVFAASTSSCCISWVTGGPDHFGGILRSN
jgi:hypothetical protein